MTPEQIASLAPLMALALTAAAAMVLAPLASLRLVNVVTGAGLLAAALLVSGRLDAPAAPVGTLFADDGLARFGAAFASLTAFAALLFMRVEGAGKEAASLIALVALGGAAMAGTRHAGIIFLGVELSSLPLVTLFAFRLSSPGLEAGYKFLILSGLASAALLFGIALIYADTGSLSLDGWSGHNALYAIGGALLLAGLGFKFSLVPFHMWTPDAFEGAPAGAAAMAGVVSKGAVAIVLLRIGTEAAPPEPVWTAGLAALGAASILFGNLLALRQSDLRRMLGYSTVAHSGYIAVIFASGAHRSGEAALFYLATYAPALLAALCVSALLGPASTLDDIRGLARRLPVEASVLSLALLSLAGLPPTGGFIAKFYLFSSLAEGRQWTLLAATAAGTALGLYYYARFLVAPFLGAVRELAVPRIFDRAVLAACAALIVLFGITPASLIRVVAAVSRYETVLIQPQAAARGSVR